MKLKLFFIILLLIPLIHAATDTTEVSDVLKLNQEVNYVASCVNDGDYCSSSARCNFTIISPSRNILVNNLQTTLLNTGSGAYHNYTITPDEIGIWQVDMVCYDGGDSGAETLYFEVTGNGKPEPPGSITVFFIIAFLIIMVFLVYFFIYSLGHFMSLDFDIIDLAFNWGIYFALFGLYMLSRYYLGNQDIEGFLLIFVSVGGLTTFLMPIFAFFISLTVGSIQKNKFNVRRVKMGFLNKYRK